MTLKQYIEKIEENGNFYSQGICGGTGNLKC